VQHICLELFFFRDSSYLFMFFGGVLCILRRWRNGFLNTGRLIIMGTLFIEIDFLVVTQMRWNMYHHLSWKRLGFGDSKPYF